MQISTLAILLILGVSLKSIGVIACGYQSCPTLNPDELNVHIIAHSHDDLGWLKTIDEYYYGTKSTIKLAGVQYVLDTVIQALLANSQRKYVQVETAFFYKWWQNQSDKKKDQVRTLINNGQLEIAGGGWSMNDEASSHYQAIIDQLTYGIKFLNETFGECARPRVGWQIDAFGHTREMASIFAQMQYDALFFARLDWRDKEERLATKTPEILWLGSDNLGNESLIFTHILYNHYSSPPGFYFDILSNDDSLIPDQRSPEYNLKTKVPQFTKYVKQQSSYYTTNNILVTMGDDFTYQDAHYDYKNLDTLIQAFEDFEQYDDKERRIKLLYSTPTCYVKAVNDYATQNGVAFKIKMDDFVPYATDSHSYWNGYYTSRPSHKLLARQGNNFLQVAKQLTARAVPTVGPTYDENIDEMKAAMGILQHHQAITGTERQNVADDYGSMFMKAFENSSVIVNSMLKRMLTKPGQSTDLVFNSCLLANISHCKESQKQRFVVAVYNPQSHMVSHHVRIPVDSDSFEVTDLIERPVKWQVTPRIDNFDNVQNLHISKFDLVFLAVNIAPLAVKLFYIVNKKFGEPVNDIEPVPYDESFKLGDDITGLMFDKTTGFLTKMNLFAFQLNVKQELMYYVGSQGDGDPNSNRSSGAFVFRPDTKDPIAKPFSNDLTANIKTYKGELIEEVHHTYNDWVKQITRLYSDEMYIEFDWLIGPIDTQDGKSKEVIARYSMDTKKENSEFSTDSNGREILTRMNNSRPTYNYTNEESIAGNYYPITTSLSRLVPTIGFEAVVVTDRTQAGTSLRNGELELMLHRRLLRDDEIGVGEALNEIEFDDGLRVRGQHAFVIGTPTYNDWYPRAGKIRREIAQKKVLAPWVFLADASSEDNALGIIRYKLKNHVSIVKRVLPEQIQILTLEQWGINKIFIRFEHMFEAAHGGTDETVNLYDLFMAFKIYEVYEVSLAGNRILNENERLQWTSSGCLSNSDDCEVKGRISRNKASDWKYTLSPMQIQSFLVVVKEH